MPTNYNTIAEDYRKASDHPIKQYIESYSFLQQLGDVRGKSVLDLACGEGYYTRLLKQQGAAHVVGLDISAAMIHQAQAAESAAPLGIEYHVQDVTQLEPGETFDVVTAIYLFPYAATKQALTAMFKAIIDNLKPGGRLVAITLNPDLRAEDASIYPPYGIRMWAAAVLRDGDAITFTVDIPHTRNDSFDLLVTYWQRQTMEHIARRAGFQKISWQTLEMSKEGLEKYPPHHWQAFLEKPYSIVLVCHK
jgi:2-polyprenyl-3-methyl-5-hydroxy-6-metoxy-1,4-benzoquinol methylase